MKRKPF